MRYYLIADEPENKIMKVNEDGLACFIKNYESKILLTGNSIQDLLLKFSDTLNRENNADTKNPPASLNFLHSEEEAGNAGERPASNRNATGIKLFMGFILLY
ncbi:MAG: hypothetical protein WDO19_15030 [Bacteroidota bacterium]